VSTVSIADPPDRERVEKVLPLRDFQRTAKPGVRNHRGEIEKRARDAGERESIGLGAVIRAQIPGPVFHDPRHIETAASRRGHVDGPVALASETP
jgi:hypothetical protein